MEKEKGGSRKDSGTKERLTCKVLEPPGCGGMERDVGERGAEADPPVNPASLTKPQVGTQVARLGVGRAPNTSSMVAAEDATQDEARKETAQPAGTMRFLVPSESTAFPCDLRGTGTLTSVFWKEKSRS